MTDIQVRSSINQGFSHKGEFVTHHQRRKDVNEFRSTHFIMGKHPSTLLSHQHYTMPKYRFARPERNRSTAQTQATNFKIGSQYRPSLQFQTTYGTVNGRGAKTGDRNGLIDIKAKRTSILLGSGNQNGFVTTN